MTQDNNRLMEAARRAAEHSYSPYSHFRVGAALLAADGAIVAGTNVENRSYGLGICAERSAIVAGIAGGHRRFVAAAVYTPDSDVPVAPCGACRQVLSEFMDPESVVICMNRTNTEHHSLAELFPHDAMHDLKDRQ
jgi:cytidine deaminase